MATSIIGYYDAESETCVCRRCGDEHGAAGVEITEGETGWEDRIRCDGCGAQLVAGGAEPGGFAALWAGFRRRRNALRRAEREAESIAAVAATDGREPEAPARGA